MARYIQYGRIGKPIKLGKLPTASVVYLGVIADIYGKLYRCVQEGDGYAWKSTTPEPIVSYRDMNHHLLVPPTRNIPTVNYIIGE